MKPLCPAGGTGEEIRRGKENLEGGLGGICIPARRGCVDEAFPRKARDEEPSQAMLQGFGPSPVCLYQLLASGRWVVWEPHSTVQWDKRCF